jgi:hypothetical protein
VCVLDALDRADIVRVAGFAARRPQPPGRRTAIPAAFRYWPAVSRRILVASWMRRSDQPSRPRAKTCCFFSSFKYSCGFATPAKHENAIYDRLNLRRTKVSNVWSRKPAFKSGLDIAPNPKLSPRIRESTRSRLFIVFDVLWRRQKELIMEEVFTCCAGLDVHKESIEACVRRIESNGRLHQETRHWGTMTQDLFAMADWMTAQGVTQVAMESTGVFWKPIFNILENRFTVLLVNARHIKQVPGRKSDIRDCQWIAQLLQHGLLKGSFIPPRSQRDLRDLTRYRTQLTDEKVRTANRIHKVLEDANIKLSSVATDVLGVSGRAMLEALIQGEEDPVKLADLARRRLRRVGRQNREADSRVSG